MTYEWQNINFNTIIGGIAPDGVLYLKTFLIDYKEEFHVEVVNPSCQKCIKNYHEEFIKKYKIMNNQCDYVLRKKREGLPLHFGSSIRVNNGNITNEYAKILLEKFEADYLFDVYPKEEKKQKETIVVPETITFQKKKKKNR